MTLKVAAVQAEPVWLDMDATVDKTVALIDEAARNGADLIGFPETWIPGYPVFVMSLPVYAQAEYVARYHANSPAIDGPEMGRIRESARRNGITVVVGYSEKDGGSLYMSQVTIGADGEILKNRRKLKPTHSERTLFGEGDGSDLVVLDTAIGRLGALNCFEHLQPLSKYAMYSQNEQIHVAGWPNLSILGMAPLLSSDAILAATVTYSYEGSCFTILSCQIMSEEGAKSFPNMDGSALPIYTGGGGIARVIGPDTSTVSETLEPDEEGIVYADIDLAHIDLAKNFLDPAGHYARGDVTQLVLNDRPRRAVLRRADLESFAAVQRAAAIDEDDADEEREVD